MPEVQEHTLNPVSNKRAPALPLVPLNYDEEEDLSPEQREAMFGAYEESMRSIGEGEIVRAHPAFPARAAGSPKRGRR